MRTRDLAMQYKDTVEKMVESTCDKDLKPNVKVVIEDVKRMLPLLPMDEYLVSVYYKEQLIYTASEPISENALFGALMCLNGVKRFLIKGE